MRSEKRETLLLKRTLRRRNWSPLSFKN
jgi:hypothetical protein